MTFDELLAQVFELLQREKRLSYRALKVRFGLDDEHLEALKDEIIEVKQLAVDDKGRVLVWSGESAVPAPPAAVRAPVPLAAIPAYLAEKIRTARGALEGERKQVTVLFAAARINRLPPEPKHLLQTAAVIGHDVPLALLRALTELPEKALHRSLAQLHGEVTAHREPPEAEQAEMHYRQALALTDELGMRPLQAHCHLGLGSLYGKMGRREQARAHLSTTIEHYRAMDVTFWLPQAEAALAQGEQR